MNAFIKNNQFEDVYLKGMDISLHLLVKGDKNGIPLVFVPGITSYCYSFAHLMNDIPDQFYCISVDLRGRGTSSWPSQGYTLSDYSNDLLLVINYLISNPISPVLIGHSMGARIISSFTSQFPRLISGLVLIDPPINGPGQRDEYPNSLEKMLLKEKRAVDEGRMEFFRSCLPAHFTKSQVQQRAEEYRNVSETAIVESYKSFLREPFHAHLKNVTTPTLLLKAEYGDVIREEELALIRRINKNIETKVLKGVGHMTYKEDPESVLTNIYQFIHKHIDHNVANFTSLKLI